MIRRLLEAVVETHIDRAEIGEHALMRFLKQPRMGADIQGRIGRRAGVPIAEEQRREVARQLQAGIVEIGPSLDRPLQA